MALFPKYCKQGAPSNVRSLRLVAHCKSDAFNAVETVLPGALIPAMLGKQGAEAPKGMMFAAQDFAGIKWQ